KSRIIEGVACEIQTRSMYVMIDRVTAKTTTQCRVCVGRVVERCIMGANDLDLFGFTMPPRVSWHSRVVSILYGSCSILEVRVECVNTIIPAGRQQNRVGLHMLFSSLLLKSTLTFSCVSSIQSC